MMPPKAQHYFSLGEQQLTEGRYQAALASYQKALKQAPSHPFLLFRIGMVHHLLERHSEAIRWYRKATSADSTLGEAHNNLGKALLELRHFQEAEAAFRAAAPLLPASPVPSASCASTLMAQNRLEEALNWCNQALTITPDFAEAHWNKALIQLKLGRYAEGWQEYEWRWQAPSFPSPRRTYSAPAWQGEPLAGKRILIHAEQGFGDTIQFSRFLPLVVRSGAEVVLVCQSELVALFCSAFENVTVLSFDAAVPSIDYHLPLLSLPRFFLTELSMIPAGLYLNVSPELAPVWSERCSAAGNATKIGLVWSGNTKPDPSRSIPAKLLRPLAALPHVAWFPLQPGWNRDDAKYLSMFNLFDLTGFIQNFADTAALISQMDLVICVDTATAHLSGALGKPVWLLLPYAADWRWLLNVRTSPWYPSMQLFRQDASRCWGTVLHTVHEALYQRAHQS